VRVLLLLLLRPRLAGGTALRQEGLQVPAGVWLMQGQAAVPAHHSSHAGSTQRNNSEHAAGTIKHSSAGGLP
jgi:hypothetical protein